MPARFGHLEERERELDALWELIRSAGEGAGAGVLIEGEAGIGKTALLAAACGRAAEEGMAVLSARAGELEGEFAWGVVRQLFEGPVARAPADEASRLLEGAAGHARPALGIEQAESAADETFPALHGLYWLTVNVAQRRPVVLSVDDLQWADAPSLRFVAHMLPRIAELPILLLLASHPRGAVPAGPNPQLLATIAADPSVRALRPAALSGTASAALVRNELGDDASEEVCLACHELTGGNPFLLRALTAELNEDDLQPGAVTAERVRRMTPQAVSASVLLRLARLSPGALSLARAVAVLGADAPLQVAAGLAGLGADEAVASSGALIRARILGEGEPLAFAHPLVRFAVYRDLAGPERSRWHYRAARLLADRGAPLERIAPHLLQSASGGDQWTVDLLRRGAAEAWTHGAPDVAADYLQRALAEPPAGESRGSVLFELGQVELVRDPAEAAPKLSEALELVQEPQRRAEVALALGDALTSLGRPADAIPFLSQGIAAAEGEGRPDLASSLEAVRLAAARWEPSTQTLRHQLVATLRERELAGEQLDPRLHSQLAIEAAANGVDREAAVRHARAALIAAERPTGAATSALPEAMLVLAFADFADEARTAIEQWLALARARAWPLATVLGATAATLASLYRGAVSEALASAWEAASPGTEIRLAPVTIAFLVEALLERGQLDEAHAELARRGLDGELPHAWATTPLLLARGRLNVAAGDHAAGIRDLLAAGERAEQWGVRNPAMHPWRSSAAVSMAQIGESDRAARLADEEVELARRWGAPRAIGVALRAAGIAHGGESGLALLREAVAVLDSSPAPLELARALADLGSALRRAGRRGEARDELRKSLDLAHELGGIAVADRAREELTVAGARPRRDALRGRDALTASELRVAQLAAAGRSNREIAEALFVTLRTVEAHLTSTYGKLGISTRQQLPAALAAATSPSGEPTATERL